MAAIHGARGRVCGLWPLVISSAGESLAAVCAVVIAAVLPTAPGCGDLFRAPVPLENRILALTWAFSGLQAARSYSLIRPFRTGFRRIPQVPRSAAATGRAERCRDTLADALMGTGGVERLRRTSQSQSRMKIRYSKRIGMTYHHAGADGSRSAGHSRWRTIDTPQASVLGGAGACAAFGFGLDAGEGGADCRLPCGRDPAGPPLTRGCEVSTEFTGIPEPGGAVMLGQRELLGDVRYRAAH
jgi:hypothetical protein